MFRRIELHYSKPDQAHIDSRVCVMWHSHGQNRRSFVSSHIQACPHTLAVRSWPPAHQACN